MLMKGDILKGAHDLVIPAYNDPAVQKMYSEVCESAKSLFGAARVGRFVEYVSKRISYDSEWNEKRRGSTVYLSDAVKEGKGVCKEKAALLYMLLRLDGVDSDYMRGTLSGSRHAWLKVKVGNGEMLADPTNMLFGNYDSVSSHNGFVEGPNPISRA